MGGSGCAIFRLVAVSGSSAVGRMTRFLSLITFAAVAVVALAGCGGGGGKAGPLSITISPTSATVGLNSQENFTAVVNNATSTTNTTVTWNVDGTAGGSATTGTIVSSGTDSEVGIFTAPASVPSTDNGVVTITATLQETSTSSSSTTTITSNTATVTIGGGSGLAITPAATTVPAGGNTTFTAALNGVLDRNVTWSASSANGGSFGSIDPHSGVFTAPLAPPPGGIVTITAKDVAASATASATATIAFSDHSFQGPFAFSFTGSDRAGFVAVAGSLVADGSGNIESGLEDEDSFTSGVSTQVAITGGNYAIGPDGRGSAVLNTDLGPVTLRLVISLPSAALPPVTHADIVRFDNFSTGSGAMDQQSLNGLNGLNVSALAGPYVFRVAGATAGFARLAIAGKFSANGTGMIPQAGSIVDINDNGSVTAADTTLNGSYAIDNTFPGSGRGTLTLTSASTGQRTFAFYVDTVDPTTARITHLKLVGSDNSGFLAGDAFSAPTSASFSAASLAKGSYAFTTGGSSGSGAYAAGGVFASDGNGNATSSFFDSDNNGKITNVTGGSCAYVVDPTTGRIDLRLLTGTGTCPAGASSSVAEFAAYQTGQGSAVLLELDAGAVSTGLAFQQQSSAALSAGNFAMNLAGQGLLHDNPGAIQQDVVGQFVLSGTAITTGTLDINNVSAAFPNDPIATTGTSFAASTGGRGTATIQASDPVATYKLLYYIIDSNTALFLGQDANRVLAGTLARQF